MAKFKMNNVDLEFDVFELDNAAIYEKELCKVLDLCQKLGESPKGIKESIEIQCKGIFDFIDALFGENMHKKLFGNSVNLRQCIKGFSDIVIAINSDKDALYDSLPPELRETKVYEEKK